ncbi:MAG TPA: DUF5655 domain-containing protein [Vicinamibacterales bacterium]|nr:DUF5655 domain-containing protein [Vicinamibacterales bacterium]
MTAAKANRSRTRARGHECYHCKQWVEAGAAHDCWTTTEAALTRELSEDLRDAWDRLRETAVSFGDQRIYASHSSIMFSRTSCYFFVRPRKNYLEVVIFLGRAVKAPQVRQVVESSKRKKANIVRVTHRDEVEAPMTDWLQEAYEVSVTLSGSRRSSRSAAPGTRGKGRSSPRS